MPASKKQSKKQAPKKQAPKKQSKKQSNKQVKLTLKGNEPMTGTCMGRECNKKKRVMVAMVFFKNPNGSVRVAGKCNRCGTNMNKFASKNLFFLK
jgi:hypothetical protein